MPDVLDGTLPSTRRVLGDVDPVQPLDTTHPLLDGVQGFWLPLPRLTGGSRLYDLSTYNRHGDLTNMDPASDWVTDSNLSFPWLRFEEANSQSVSIPPIDIEGAAELTVACWVQPEQGATERDGIVGWNETGSFGEMGLYRGEVGSTSEVLHWRLTDGSQVIEVSTNTGLGQGGQALLLGTVRENDTTAFFVDGEKQGEKSFGTKGPVDDSRGRIGEWPRTDQHFEGAITGVYIALTRFSDQQAKAFYDQARRGFPDLLNRRDSVGLIGGGPSPISGTAAITDSQEQVSATGQTEGSGILSITDGSETLTVDGATKVSGTASITEAAEQISGAGQTEVSGTASVTDESETLTISGATKVSGTASVTEAVETVLASGSTDVQGDFALTDSGEIITASGTVITTGTVQITDGGEGISIVSGLQEILGSASITDGTEDVSATGETEIAGNVLITDSGEIISAVSALQDITGTAQITDAAEEVDATGEVKIAGTASLADGTEEVIIVGQNDVTGSVSFADLAAEIAAEGAVEVQGSLALTDLGESISAREGVPARLARVHVRLEDIIVLHATLEDALTVHATLEDTLTVDAKLTD